MSRRRAGAVSSGNVGVFARAAMVRGVVPLLLATGAGAAARFSMGLVIFSGISIGATINSDSSTA